MKKLWLLVILWCSLPLAAGEVYFIPGWYSKWVNYSKHSELLQNIFPEESVFIRQWESNKLWKNAKKEAENYTGILTDEMLTRKSDEVTLVGHSLGGRITLDCVAELARQKKQLRQVILLGTAGEITDEDIKNCQKVSLLPVINIFCVDDNMLKLFLRKEHTYPLGLAGLNGKTAHFKQYRMTVTDGDIKLWKITVVPEDMAEPFRETSAHLAMKYLQHLQKVQSGSVQECYYDLPGLENIASESSVKNDYLPGFFKLVDEFDSWQLYRRSYRIRYCIISPTGKTFYYTAENHAYETFAKLKAVFDDNNELSEEKLQNDQANRKTDQ